MRGDAGELRTAGIAIAVAAWALIALPATAGAALIGPPTSTLDAWDFGRVCALDSSCTFTNVRLSNGNAQAPVTGTITRWRARVGLAPGGTGPVPVKLQVLERTVNKPGTAADRFKAVRESAEELAAEADGVQAFDASLKIREGDFIGLAALTEDVEVFGVEDDPGNLLLQFVPPLVPGDGAETRDTGLPDQGLLLNAKIRP